MLFRDIPVWDVIWFLKRADEEGIYYRVIRSDIYPALEMPAATQEVVHYMHILCTLGGFYHIIGIDNVSGVCYDTP